jgi:Transposase DDE domain
MFSKTELNPQYPIALLLSTSPRKTFESLGRQMEISGDTVSRLLDLKSPNLKDLIDAAQKIFRRKRPYLIIDDTLILKIYSRCIEGTSDNYYSGDGVTYRSICSITAMITDGTIAIPIDQSIWTSHEVDPVNYMKKASLAQELITRIQMHEKIDIVIMDGLYATKEMIKWLNESKISFEMRFHSNRVVEVKGGRYQIKECPLLKLKGRRTERTIRASWHGINLYFTAVKRLLKKGKFITVFQVSNYKASARNHIRLYGYRWNIEKFFRTAKQHLGLNDCQSRKIGKQKNHILNVFVAYTIAQFECVKRKYKNVETAIKSIKLDVLKRPDYLKRRFREIFHHV